MKETEIREAFIKWHSAETTFALGVPDDRSIADWWLAQLEAQRTADLEALREGMPEPVKLTKEEENSIEGENRHYDYMVVRNDTEKKYRTKVLSLIEQIMNKKI